VWTATFYLQGAASQWYYRWEKNHGVPDWKTFVDGVHKRFAPHLRSNPLGELSHCRRTGSVDEYVDQFLKLLARCEDVSETQQIDLFTAGLLQPMCTDVEMHSPATLEDAMALTCSYERRLQITNDIARGPARPAKAAATPSSTPSTASNQAKPGAPSAQRPAPPSLSGRDGPTSPGGPVLQLPGEFSKEHLKQCPMRGIYIMDLEDDDNGSTTSFDGEPEVSIHALTGIHAGDKMLLSTTASNVPLVALIDSGSTHCFMSTDTATRLGLQPTPRPGLSVAVANG